MGSGYTAQVATPNIKNGVMNQAAAAYFGVAVQLNGTAVQPSGSAMLRWRANGGSETALAIPIPAGSGAVLLAVPAGSFPAAARVEYLIELSGWGGMVSVPLDDNGNLRQGAFNTISPPTAVSLQPSGGFVLRSAPALFGWTMAYNKREVDPTVAQGSALFEWRPKGGAVKQVRVQGAANALSLPANTLPSGEVEWRVTITASDGALGPASAWVTVSTVDSLSVAELVSPRGLFLSGNEVNRFAWRHIISTGTPQTKAELQKSQNQTAWTALATVTGAAQETLVPANALPGGTVWWRVRTYNSDGKAGAWSEAASMVVYAAPPMPAILPPEGLPLVTLRWQSTGQQGFEVVADGWSSGTVYGVAKELAIPRWLSDGPHLLGVRVQSELGLWSEWATVTVQVKNQPPGEISLSCRAVERGVAVSWSTPIRFAHYILYRDGKPIAKTERQSHTDQRAGGKHDYQVRGVLGGMYALSNCAVEFSRGRWGAISDVERLDWIPLKVRRGSTPTREVQAERTVTPRWFVGRTLPVAEVSPYLERRHTLGYTYRPGERENAERVMALLGRTVIYKDELGALVIGTLASISDTHDRAVDTTLTILETDYKEVGEHVF